MLLGNMYLRKKFHFSKEERDKNKEIMFKTINRRNTNENNMKQKKIFKCLYKVKENM